MAVAQPLDFEIEFARNAISGSAAWFSVIILKFIFTAIFDLQPEPGLPAGFQPKPEARAQKSGSARSGSEPPGPMPTPDQKLCKKIPWYLKYFIFEARFL